MPLDSLLIEILVDPQDKEPLWYLEAEEMLYNPRLRRRYAIRYGTPFLLINEAEHQAIEAKPHVLTGAGPASGTGS